MPKYLLSEPIDNVYQKIIVNEFQDDLHKDDLMSKLVFCFKYLLLGVTFMQIFVVATRNKTKNKLLLLNLS
jgi:hypothetical protein